MCSCFGALNLALSHDVFPRRLCRYYLHTEQFEAYHHLTQSLPLKAAGERTIKEVVMPKLNRNGHQGYRNAWDAILFAWPFSALECNIDAPTHELDSLTVSIVLGDRFGWTQTSQCARRFLWLRQFWCRWCRRAVISRRHFDSGLPYGRTTFAQFLSHHAVCLPCRDSNTCAYFSIHERVVCHICGQWHDQTEYEECLEAVDCD